MLTRTRARRLSRRGEHTAALALSAGQDIEVLSRAGMHLSVLEKSKDPSIFRAIALAQVGRVEEALEMLDQFRGHQLARSLIGYLATIIPKKILDFVDNQRKWRQICLYSKTRVSNIKPTAKELRKLSPSLAVYLSQKSSQFDLAKENFIRLFQAESLSIPDTPWDTGLLNIHTLSCAVNNADIIKDAPLVSVVLTAYNEEAYLGTALQSLLRQAWRPIEIIVVDDGSTDSTFEIAQNFQKEDDRVKPYRLDKNSGIWGAKNFGIGKSKGEFITMHDADDWSHPYKISNQMKPLIASSAMACSSSYFLRVDEETGQLFSRNADNFLRWNPSSLLFRKAVVDEVGRFQSTGLGNDCEFVTRIENRFGTKQHSRIRKPLSIGLWRRDGLSNKFRDGEKAIDRLRQWEKWRLEQLNLNNS